MMGLRFPGDIPFSDVYVHSIIQAPDGRRMSKSLGTGIDPLDLIDGGPRPPVFAEGGDFPAYGADALRFGLLAMSSTQDVRFSEEKIQQGQALANKLYNATRFVALRVGEGVAPSPQPRTVEDRWILSRLQAIEADTRARIDGFDFAKAALGLYDFVYGDLCDWYLELVKPRLSDGADAGDRAALGATLLHVLRETIATAHPIIPFVTEELWDLLGYAEAEGLLAAGRLPEPDEALRDEAAEAEMGRAIEAIKALRAWRDSVGVKAGAIVPGRAARERLRRDRHAHRRLGALRPARGGGRRRRGAGRDRRDPRRSRRRAGVRRRRPRRRRPPPGAGARAARARDPARRGQARQRGLRRQGARRPSSPPSARSSSACARSSWRCRSRRGEPLRRIGRGAARHLDRRRRRALAAVARAVRHALRPGPHAPADGRARRAERGLALDPRRRHERQVLDGADDRRPARAPRRARGRLPVAAPRLLRRAHPRRRRGHHARAVRRRRRTRARRGRGASTARSAPTTA